MHVDPVYPLHDDGPESLSLLHMGRRRTDNRINKCSPIETNVFDVGPRIIVPLYIALRTRTYLTK